MEKLKQIHWFNPTRQFKKNDQEIGRFFIVIKFVFILS